MALVKYAAPVDEIRGSLGGITYSANKSGTYAKVWAMPSKPFSPPQSNQRAFMGSHGSYWNALTQAQRDDWNTYAAAAPQELTNSLGQTYYATGFNWYCRINNHLLSAGAARRATYPTLTRQAAPTINWVNFDVPIDDPVDVSFGYPSNHFLGYIAVLYLAFGPQSSALAPKNRWRLTYADKGIYTSQERCGDEALALFGNPPLLWRVFWRIYKQDSQGQRSPATEKMNITTV